MIKSQSKNSGLTLIETIFYVALLAVFSVVVINTLLVMTRSFRETSVYGDIVKASSIMERISREIKQADGIVSISSGDLQLSTGQGNPTPTLLRIVYNAGNIEIWEGGVLLGNLNSSNIAVSNLLFLPISTTAGAAVKVGLGVSSTRDESASVYEFYNTSVLRGAY